jgi:hypothetical protein
LRHDARLLYAGSLMRANVWFFLDLLSSALMALAQ